MSILIATQFTPAEWAQWEPALRQALPHETLLTAWPVAEPDAVDIAIVANPPAGSLRGLNRLRLIQSLWAGVDKLLADPGLPAGVPLARMVDPAMNEAMAETALWAVLSLHRGFFAYAKQQREGQWRQRAQRRADEVRVLVLGLGQMGRTVAERLARNGYAVSGWSTREARLHGVATQAGDAALPAMLAKAEIVVNLLPLTPSTAGIFNAQTFSQLRHGASLVNLARGAHVVEADLLVALDSGQVGHAVLDVFQVEPLPADHPLWRHPSVTVLPHVAALTDPRSAAEVVSRNVQAVRQGLLPEHQVDRARGY
jgi:glyoxylate/hydroxypyruvate reductase A